MGNGRIQDLPSVKKLLDDIHTLEQFKRALPLLRPVLRLLRVQVEQMEAALAQAEALAGPAHELATLPDRFNEVFASRGWIMYEMMNVEVTRAAVAKATAGDLDGAERDLVDHYDAEQIRHQLIWMGNVKAFRPRLRLAELARVDYVEGRYHACVPVVLALLDGLVNDLGPRGFFAEGVNLEAWDSVAAHSSGLAELAKVLGKPCRKTRSESIALPYRHGILHGLDLGYDNKMVAAKAWAALFATRDWALKVERGQVTAPPTPPKPTWGQILRQLRENVDDKARLEAWVPRTIRPGEDIPASGEPEAYEEGMPEQRLAEFLVYWRARNYGRMAQCLLYSPYRQEQGLNKVAGRLRADYDARRLKAFAMLELRDEAPAITVIRTKLIYDEGESEREHIVEYRLVYEDAAGRPLVRGKVGGAWKVVG